MIDPDNNVIFQIEAKFSQGKWVTLEVPEGEQLIGVKSDKCFERLGFICFKP